MDGDRPVWTGGPAPAGPVECEVQLRAHGEPVPATVRVDGGPAGGRAAPARPAGSRPGRRSSPTGPTRPATSCSARPPSVTAMTAPLAGGRGDRHRLAARHRHRRGAADRARRAAGPAAPARAAGPRPGRRHDRARRRPAGRAAGRDVRRRAGGSPAAPAATCGAPATCWTRDLDQLTEQAAGYTGPLKVQAAGPWTLAASVDLPIGRPAAARPRRGPRPGRVAGRRAARARRRRRRPGARRARCCSSSTSRRCRRCWPGGCATESGLGTLRAVERDRRGQRAAGGRRAPRACRWWSIAARRTYRWMSCATAGAAAVALDLGLVADLDALGEAIDAGLGLFAGAAPTPPAGAGPSAAQVADRVRDLWRKLGFPLAQLPEQVVVTPACGLAGASGAQARAVLQACRDAGRRLRDEARRVDSSVRRSRASRPQRSMMPLNGRQR